MDITLSLVRLRYEEIADVSTDVILVTHGIATKYLLKSASSC